MKAILIVTLLFLTACSAEITADVREDARLPDTNVTVIEDIRQEEILPSCGSQLSESLSWETYSVRHPSTWTISGEYSNAVAIQRVKSGESARITLRSPEVRSSQESVDDRLEHTGMVEGGMRLESEIDGRPAVIYRFTSDAPQPGYYIDPDSPEASRPWPAPGTITTIGVAIADGLNIIEIVGDTLSDDEELLCEMGEILESVRF